MSKKNLPNIPIYIGDWERDCNVLSLESEAAWMRIVFKLWTKGKQNTIKIPTKSLQNLWRCDEVKMNEILDDLIYNEIAEIDVDNRFVEFTCRRFVKENNLSEIRSAASKGQKKNVKTVSKPKQTSNKNEQNTENDYENENDYVDENKSESENFGKSENLLQPSQPKRPKSYRGKRIITDYDTLITLDELEQQIEAESSWKVSILRNTREAIPSFSEEELEDRLAQFFKQLENDGESEKTVKEFKKHFSRWLNIELKKAIQNDKTNSNKGGASSEFRRKTAQRLGAL